MEKKKRKSKDNIFFHRMVSLGFDEVTEFARNSDIDLSFETCRRLIYDWSQNIEYEHVIILMQKLDFTTTEIKDELVRRGDKHIHNLISDSAKGKILNDQETKLVNEMRNIPGLTNVFLTHIDICKRLVKEAKKGE